ncbi:contractile injection system protein, VgrG/Pvc8 family [Photobacterium halotolerans]|uniref:Phage protein D n=1 Tax=Photobacterium halotolerans TaxID=265726 RepID=A0A7X5AU89_9GAMM|nr:contractile injection system protein, VgrG/Pvc8 family [Photobacterium halotolerans]NAW66707.1 hypothetical protein [Photobacterium halotolerans]
MITLEGKHADMMMSRLKSWRLEDGNGLEGDSLTLVLNSDDIDGLPPKGEPYLVKLGDVVRDTFQISKRSFGLSPREVTLVCTVAPFSITDSTGYRERKSASWDKTTLAQVVSDCVAPHGYAIFVHPRLQKIEIEHIDRTDESTQAFLSRLAKQFDAIAKPVNDTFVVVPIGEVKSATGKAIETITLSLPQLNQPGSAQLVNVSGDLDGRNDFNGVRAFYVSTNDGTKQEVKVGTSPFKLLGKDKNSKTEAEQACAAELRKLQREGRKVTIDAPANPAAFAEGLIVLDGTFPSVAAGTYSIDRVSLSGQGQQPARMSINATLTGDKHE